MTPIVFRHWMRGHFHSRGQHERTGWTTGARRHHGVGVRGDVPRQALPGLRRLRLQRRRQKLLAARQRSKHNPAGPIHKPLQEGEVHRQVERPADERKSSSISVSKRQESC